LKGSLAGFAGQQTGSEAEHVKPPSAEEQQVPAGSAQLPKGACVVGAQHFDSSPEQ